MIFDALGNEMSGADAVACDHYERGLRQLQTFTGDPAASADAAIAKAPDFAMAHIFKGWLFALATDPEAMRVAQSCHAAASALPLNERERKHADALGALVEGRWHEAGARLAALTGRYRRDALALQAGHQIDFFTGNAPMLRDRIADALPAWDESMPGYHAILSAHAFGLEENGDYAAAEAAGRRAVEIEPRDGWGQHAVAHVMEMQGRLDDGIAWMRAEPQSWAADSFLKVHNWWHLALFHFERGEHEEALALNDGPIAGGQSGFVLNLVDSSALLWRLRLKGVDAGDRWERLAELWAPLAGAGNYAFNDMHAMMAFVSAGRHDLAASLLDAQSDAIEASGDNASFTRDVGRPAVRGIMAFAEGDYRAAISELLPLETVAHRFGGSHAQRDILTLTLTEAALRAGDGALAQSLGARRLAVRPQSPLAKWFSKRAAQLGPHI